VIARCTNAADIPAIEPRHGRQQVAERFELQRPDRARIDDPGLLVRGASSASRRAVILREVARIVDDEGLDLVSAPHSSRSNSLGAITAVARFSSIGSRRAKMCVPSRCTTMCPY
jgi:hypothetical protein